MDKKIKLNLIGITYNQIDSGVYALILQQDGGTRRIPIIIGYPEAQAIECRLQDIKTPRPLTHDMANSILEGFGIKLREVFIHHLENGVFAADLILDNGEKTIILDARSSDAIALAIRANAPIYTSEEVLRTAGLNPEEKKVSTKADSPFSTSNQGEVNVTGKPSAEKKSIDSLSKSELLSQLDKAVEKEDYVEAARIKNELDRRAGLSDSGKDNQ